VAALRAACAGCALLAGTVAWAEDPPPAASDSSERVTALQGQVDGMAEQVQTLQGDMDKLKKLKLSGYVQVRWETAENKSDSVQVTGPGPTITPANNERFYIRRGRFKATYDSSPLSQEVLYFDGSSSGSSINVRLLEAYVTLFDPWTVLHRHAVTIGQISVPFGYEIERSSSERELPERSRAETVLFPGERDRGVKLVSQWTPQVETVVGIFNGDGINSVDYPTADPSSDKDFIARVRGSLGWADAAVSWYGGRATTALTGPDVETDKTRFGLDAQTFYEMPTLGGGSFRGELYRGTDVNADSVTKLTTTPVGAGTSGRVLKPGAVGSHLATEFIGWYLMWVQNLGERTQFAARVDTYDPNLDLDHDQYWRTSLCVNWFFDGFTRLTASYDIITTEVANANGTFRDPHDNLWTFQVQHKF
jgi:hypothetical protein